MHKIFQNEVLCISPSSGRVNGLIMFVMVTFTQNVDYRVCVCASSATESLVTVQYFMSQVNSINSQDFFEWIVCHGHFYAKYRCDLCCFTIGFRRFVTINWIFGALFLYFP